MGYSELSQLRVEKITSPKNHITFSSELKRRRKILIAMIIAVAAMVILVATPIIYRAPIYGCHCNIPNDDYESVTRYYFRIGGESIQGHYTFYFSETVGISIS